MKEVKIFNCLKTVISPKRKGHQLFKGIKSKGTEKRKDGFGYIPMVGGVKTKARTNPYP